MNIIFICQVVDENDPVQATTVRWISVLSSHPKINQVTVLTLRVGSVSLPHNVEVCEIGNDSRLSTIISFYKQVFVCAFRQRTVFFIYQNGPYPILLVPFRWLARKKVFQWLAHPHNGWQTRLNAILGTTKIFTSTPSAFPLSLSHVHVVGQGVNLDRFKPLDLPVEYDLVTVGRIAPVKNLDLIIRSLSLIRAQFGVSYTMVIYGNPAHQADKVYLQDLIALVSELELDGSVEFAGSVKQDELPNLLPKAQTYISCSDTALDRAVVEAMACGLPVVSANICVAEAIPLKLHNELICNEKTQEALATKIHDLLQSGTERMKEIGMYLRRVVQEEHGDVQLFDRVVAEMEKELG